jgi:hypothetical protein
VSGSGAQTGVRRGTEGGEGGGEWIRGADGRTERDGRGNGEIDSSLLGHKKQKAKKKINLCGEFDGICEEKLKKSSF